MKTKITLAVANVILFGTVLFLSHLLIDRAAQPPLSEDQARLAAGCGINAALHALETNGGNPMFDLRLCEKDALEIYHGKPPHD